MFKRDLYLKKLEMYAGRDVAKIIIGMRRTGKTTILRQFIDELKSEGIPEENIVYINFEGLVFSYFKSAGDLRGMLYEFVKSAKGRMYFFLDDMQGVENWAEVISEMMNFHDCEFYICSSNESILYSGFAKQLSYRYVRIDVYPYVFSEFLKMKNDSESSSEELFREYLSTGGMPAVYNMSETERENYLRDTCSAILLKDVVQCNKLRDISHIDRIMEFILTHMGETFSPKAIKDYVKEHGTTISVDTVYSFLDALCGAHIVYRVPRYDIKEERELETQEKYYFADIAMRNAVCGEAEISRDACLENVLYIELLTRGFKVNIGKYGSDTVDFVATKGDDRSYLNCCSVLSTKEDIKKEFSTLTKIRDNYFKMVLSMEADTKVNKGGIINYPLLSFLEQV